MNYEADFADGALFVLSSSVCIVLCALMFEEVWFEGWQRKRLRAAFALLVTFSGIAMANGWEFISRRFRIWELDPGWVSAIHPDTVASVVAGAGMLYVIHMFSPRVWAPWSVPVVTAVLCLFIISILYITKVTIVAFVLSLIVMSLVVFHKTFKQ